MDGAERASCTNLPNVKGLSANENLKINLVDVKWSSYSCGGYNLSQGGFNDGWAYHLGGEFAKLWQQAVNSGNKLPDLYVIQIAYGAQGFRSEDIASDRWRPDRDNTDLDSLHPFSQRVLALAVQNLIKAGKTPRIIGLHWNQWEAENIGAWMRNSDDVTNAYRNFLNTFRTTLGNANFPVYLYRPRSSVYTRSGVDASKCNYLANGMTALTSSPDSADKNFRLFDAADALDSYGRGIYILWNQKGTTNYKLWTMNGATVVSEQVMQSPVVGWSIVSTADFNGDGKADLLWKKDGTDYYVTWLMNGPAIISGAIHNAQPGWTVKSLADFNGDGKADILWYHSSINRYYMWLMYGNSVVDGSGYISEDPLSGWYIRAVDDFNGDGKADIFWGNSTTNSYFIWYFNGSKVINGMGIQKPAPGWEVYSSADFDGDKKSDLLWYNAASQKYYLWLLKGSAAGQAGSNYLSSQPFPSWQILK